LLADNEAYRGFLLRRKSSTSRSGAGSQGVFTILHTRRVSISALHSLSAFGWLLVLFNAFRDIAFCTHYSTKKEL